MAMGHSHDQLKDGVKAKIKSLIANVLNTADLNQTECLTDSVNFSQINL